MAIVVYFRTTLAAMARDWVLSVAQRREVGESRLAWAVLFGTIPAGVVGLVLRDDIETTLRSPLVIACTTIGYAVLLFAADRFGSHQRDERSIGWLDVVVIGCAQALALDPGHVALGRDDDGGAVPRHVAPSGGALLVSARGASDGGRWALGDRRLRRACCAPRYSRSRARCGRVRGDRASPAFITCSNG